MIEDFKEQNTKIFSTNILSCVFALQSIFFQTSGAPPPIFPYYILMLFIMRLLKASCHLEEGLAAGSDKWITDGIHPQGQTGPVDNRIRDKLLSIISKKLRFTERKRKYREGETDRFRQTNGVSAGFRDKIKTFSNIYCKPSF